jgi:hypothetical protein
MFKPVDGGSLALFRFFFGAILAYHVLMEAQPGLIQYKFIRPQLHFTYPLFDLLRLEFLPGGLLLSVIKLAGIGACGIAFGLYYRWALLIFLCSYGYLFLLDKSYYNNHSYLILLLVFLLMFMRANGALSMDALRDPDVYRRKVPFWNVFLLRAQICIVYFFAGVAKLFSDFLAGRQLTILLIEQNRLPFLPLLREIFPTDLIVRFLTYSVVSFDLFIGFFLCFRPTRTFAIFTALCFHLLVNHMFSMKVFPSLMICALLLFLDPDKFTAFRQKVLSVLGWKESSGVAETQRTPTLTAGRKDRLTMALVMLYLLVQVLVPLRHFLVPGDVNWTKENIRFSWMVMAHVMHGTMKITAIDRTNNENIPIMIDEDITPAQYSTLIYSPDMIHQYAQYLKKKLQAQGVKDPAIYMEVYLSLNGRSQRPFIDPKVDLAKTEYKFMRAANWILPPPDDM